MIPHAQLLLRFAQPLRRVDGAPETAFDVGTVLCSVLPQGDMGTAFVQRGTGTAGVHGAGMLHGDPVGLDHLGGQCPGGKAGKQPLQMQVQRRFGTDLAVKEGKFCKNAAEPVTELLRHRCRLRGKGGGKPAFVGGHDRGAAPQHLPPACRLHGIDQLVFCHPFLTGKFVLDGKKVGGMVAAHCLQHRAAGQLQPVDGVFQIQPRQIVQQGLPHIPLPQPKDAADQGIAVISVHQPHHGVHVKINGAVGVPCQKQRLKSVGSGSRPDLICRPPLLCGVALGLHQPNSFPASSFAGIRVAITSRISPCS